MIYDEPNLPIGLEIEFVNDIGDTIAVVTLHEEDVEKV
jgi:hypothetical protein